MLSRACGRLGGALLPNTRVAEIVTEGAAVAGVQTSRGEIRARVVVDAAGAWLRLVAALAGSSVKLVPTRHQLMVTVPLPEVRANQPITRIIDANVYVRPEKGGLMLGGYEADPVQFDMADLPVDFRIEDLELDLSVLRRLAESVAVQFPIFRGVALQEHRGGLPTMTADGKHVLGPAPGINGLFVIGGCCVGGLSIAPALGELLAEWIVHGDPSMDVSFMAPDRLATGLPEDKLRELCKLHYAHHYWSPATIPGVV
jgi:glycine/D-amino acid oxidase-like deaminating enzyme